MLDDLLEVLEEQHAGRERGNRPPERGDRLLVPRARDERYAEGVGHRRDDVAEVRRAGQIAEPHVLPAGAEQAAHPAEDARLPDPGRPQEGQEARAAVEPRQHLRDLPRTADEARSVARRPSWRVGARAPTGGRPLRMLAVGRLVVMIPILSDAAQSWSFARACCVAMRAGPRGVLRPRPRRWTPGGRPAEIPPHAAREAHRVPGGAAGQYFGAAPQVGAPLPALGADGLSSISDL